MHTWRAISPPPTPHSSVLLYKWVGLISDRALELQQQKTILLQSLVAGQEALLEYLKTKSVTVEYN